MIHTNSLIDGFPVILGSFPIQFAMTAAMLIAIRVPQDADGNQIDHCKMIYRWVLVAHICNLLCQGIKHYFDAKWHLIKKQITIVCLMIQLLMINTICGEWIFEEDHKNESFTAADNSSNMIQFDIWITLEACVFLSYIGSCILYLFIRSFKDQEYNLSTGREIATESTDTLEQSSITMECFESFFSPLFATGMLRSHLFDFDYRDLMKEHSGCNFVCHFFVWFSFIQVVLACFLNFVPVWKRRGNRTRNKICPTIHFIAFISLIFIIPVLKIITFVTALLMTDIWDTIVGPWLTACCFVAIFIMAVWYPTVLRKAVKDAKIKLKIEQEWEEVRMESKKEASKMA